MFPITRVCQTRIQGTSDSLRSQGHQRCADLQRRLTTSYVLSISTAVVYQQLLVTEDDCLYPAVRQT